MTLVLANIIQDIFAPLISVFESVLLFFHDTVGLSWGLAIIALTITVRTILIPLTYKQLKATQSLQQHAPELKKLQERYKDDPEKRNQEMMKFYKENKVNPFGSCLPLLFQLPVFISLFYMLRTDLKVDICPGIRQFVHTSPKFHSLGSTTCTDYGTAIHHDFPTSFLFIPDITAPATGVVLAVLMVLYIGSQLASSMIMSVTADRNQRLLMMGLPFVFTIFIISFPAGLILYWITTNFWTVGQAVVVRRMRTRHEAEKEALVGVPIEGTAALVANGSGSSSTELAAGPKPKGKAKSSSSDASNGSNGAGSGAVPPPPPRRKKKRSGRRR